MPLDVLDADFVELGSNGVGGSASRCLDAQRLKFDLIVKVLPRDDPLRRSYLQRWWHTRTVGQYRTHMLLPNSAQSPKDRILMASSLKS
jgi:hypothetical protein